MHDHHHKPAFRFPVAVLAAGIWLRMAALLPLLALLWAAIAWALASE